MATGTGPDGPNGPTGPPDTGWPAADTAGVPWTGRELPRQPFQGDLGAADADLAAALAAWGAGAGPLADVVRALGPSRLLVPVVAVVGEEHPLPTHARGDLGADMALVTLTGPDGRRALPAFTATGALAAWDPTARPVPVEAARAALAAVAEGCDVLVLDAAGPVTCVVPRPAVWALARGQEWVPPGDDAELSRALATAVGPVPDVVGVRLTGDGDAAVTIVLGVRAGLDRVDLDAAVGAARDRIAGVELLAERAEAVRIEVRPA